MATASASQQQQQPVQEGYKGELSNDDCNGDNDDAMSHTSADWMLTNRSVVLTHAADPWNHPLLMDVDEEYSDVVESSNRIHGGKGVALATSSGALSMDFVAESWMTPDDLPADEPDDVLHNDDDDAHNQHYPMWMEGLELDPILSGGSIAMAFGTNYLMPSQSPPPPASATHDSWHHRGLLPSTSGSADNIVAMDDDVEALHLLVMDEMECLLEKCHNDVGTQATTVSSGSVSSSEGNGGYGVDGSVLTVPSPPPSFGTIIPFNPSTTTVPSSEQVEKLSPTEAAAQFSQRRTLLAASMRASQISRQCLHMKEHVERRQVLQKVLKEIAQSTATVQRHCLQIENTSSEASESSSNDDMVADAIEDAKPAPTVTADPVTSTSPTNKAIVTQPKKAISTLPETISSSTTRTIFKSQSPTTNPTSQQLSQPSKKASAPLNSKTVTPEPKTTSPVTAAGASLTTSKPNIGSKSNTTPLPLPLPPKPSTASKSQEKSTASVREAPKDTAAA